MSAGTGTARRFARGFTPLLGFATPQDPDFAALAPYCDGREQFYWADWTGAEPSDWRVDLEATMYRMVWEGPAPERDEAPQAIALGPEHREQAMELAAIIRPGPFGPRTIEVTCAFGSAGRGWPARPSGTSSRTVETVRRKDFPRHRLRPRMTVRPHQT